MGKERGDIHHRMKGFSFRLFKSHHHRMKCQTQMMDVREAKRTLKEFQGAEHICNVFKKTNFISDSEMEALWDNYLEFMIVKALCQDGGSHKGMLFSTTPIMDDLWHCHILETSLYDDFMVLVKRVNPMMEKIHHSSGLALTPEADKIHRRNATAIAYRNLFGKECEWIIDCLQNCEPSTRSLSVKTEVGEGSKKIKEEDHPDENNDKSKCQTGMKIYIKTMTM